MSRSSVSVDNSEPISTSIAVFEHVPVTDLAVSFILKIGNLKHPEIISEKYLKIHRKFTENT